MQRPSQSALQGAMARQDANAVSRILRVPVGSPKALWAAAAAGLTAVQLGTLARAAKRSADAGVALGRLLDLVPVVRLPVAQWSAEGRLALAAVLGGSAAASRYIAARPALGARLCQGGFVRQRKPLAVMRDELRLRRARAVDEAAFEIALRRYRVREWVRIVARDLSGLGSTADVFGELSDLAEAIIEALTRTHLRRERSLFGPWTADPHQTFVGFAVVAQGKLGAQELNVSSDVDVQFLYSLSDPAAGAAPAVHERAHRVAQRLVQSLSRRDVHGFCYRVDVDLRPEGKKGALVNSVAGAEHYYEVWGQTWERLALIRARHVGGAAWVTRTFVALMRPFVYPRSLDMAAVDEIRALKERLHQERKGARQQSGQIVGIDIKRDSGCIREIELFVQILQTLHGGRNPALQTTSLLLALQNLQFAGILPQAHGDALSRAYLFFRDVENALQAMDERQTHRLPDDAATLEALARLVGRRAARLLQQIGRKRRTVTRVSASLFAQSRAGRGTRQALQALTQAGEAQHAALVALGFGEPREAAGLLGALSQAVGGPFSRHAPEKVRRLAAPLLCDLAASPDPDQALRLFGALNTRLKRHAGYLQMLREIPPLRRRLTDLLGTSEFLGRTIVYFPELIDWLAAARDPASLLARRPDTMLIEVMTRLQKLTDTDLQLRSLRRFKLQEQLRIGMLDLAGTLPVGDVQAQLTLLAEVCLRACWDLTRWDLQGRVGSACEQGFAVVALGRLGAGEMGYGSDLDLLFMYDEQAGGPDAKNAVRLAQRLIQTLTLQFSEGALYPIDTRLRPSGAQGPLVSSAQGFVHYHRDSAMLWERQALLRARPVAGDLALGHRVLEALAQVRYPATFDAAARQEIDRLRGRMQHELAHEYGGRSNIKTGRGGLVDVEFVVQTLQLQHAHAHPELQVTSTGAALAVLQTSGLLAKNRCQALIRAYRFLRLLEMRLRIVHDRPIAAIDFDSPSAVQLARRMGYTTRQRGVVPLRREYERTTQAVRRIYEHVVQAKAPEGMP